MGVGGDSISNFDYDLKNIKAVVVDEVGMMTIPMFYKLLNVLKKSGDMNVVFMGDPAQLPAIGPSFAEQIMS